VANHDQVFGSQDYPFTYTYNLADALTSTTYPSGRVVTTTYDQANRPSGLSGTLNSTATQYLADITYAPHGGWAGQTYNKNQMGRLFTYNNRLQPTEMKDGVPTLNGSTVASVPNPLLDLQYLWGSTTLNGNSTSNNGNLTGQNIITQNPTASFTQSYSYDTLNRIASAGESGANAWSEQFNADRYGNLWLTNADTLGGIPTQSLMPSAPSFFNASTNQLTSVSYDQVGNQTVFGSFTLAYDAEGRQISAQSSGSATVSYAYDGQGERVSKSVAGGLTTTYVHDVFGNLAAEYTTGGTASPPPCTTCYLSWDHLGSTRLMTDQNGNPVGRHDYLPFGVEIPAGYAGRTSAWGTADNVTAKFTGQERDAETGLDFFQARYHGSAQGRFLSPDPLGNFVASTADPQSWNMYAYVRNNPLSLVDPSGLDYCDLGGGDYSYDPSAGGLTEDECSYENETWMVPAVTFEDTVTQDNSQATYYYGDDSGDLDGSTLDAGFTFYATGTTTALPPGGLTNGTQDTRCAAGVNGAGFGWVLGVRLV
jgi:RHS repeat-associated protein